MPLLHLACPALWDQRPQGLKACVTCHHSDLSVGTLTQSLSDEVVKVLMSVSCPVSFRVLPGGSFNFVIFKS